ncbi:MAG: MFS transporter, partial [bacterium]
VGGVWVRNLFVRGFLRSDQSSASRGFPARVPFFYGWVLVGVGFMGFLASGAGQSFTVSTFVGPITGEFGLSRTSFFSAYGLGTLTAAAALMYVGRLIDRIGPRLMLAGVGFLLGFSAMLFSLVGGLVTLFVGFTALRLFGQGSMMLCSTNLTSQWFIRRRGLALSLVNLGFALGSAAYPASIQWLIGQQGWRSAWLWLGGATWVLVVPAALLLVRNRPEAVGLLPDGDPAAAPGEQPGGAPETTETPSWELREALRTPQFWIMSFAMAVPSGLITGMVVIHISYFSEMGLSPQAAANIFTVIAASMVACTLGFGWLLDRYPTRFVVALGLLAMAAAMLVMFFANSPALAAGYGVAMGAAQGAMMTMSNYVWPRYFGRKHLGSVQGAAFTIVIFGAAVGPLPFGRGFDLLGGYREVLLGLVIVPVAAAALVFFTRPPVKSGA